MKHLLSFLLAALLLLTCSSAHPGSTDGQGGHTDHSTGEYHYHHGYPAHQHPDGTCIYEFDDKTGQNSGTPGGGSKTTQKVTTTATIKATTKNSETKHELTPFGKFVSNVIGFGLLYCLPIFSIIFLIRIGIEMHQDTKQKKLIEQKRQKEKENLKHARASQRYDFLHDHFTDEEMKVINLKAIPDDITFSSSGLPIKGEASDDEPFGSYTVYFSSRGRCFHYNPSCIKEYASTHLFIALKYYTPCSHCVKWYHEKEIPEWYLPIKELLEKK